MTWDTMTDREKNALVAERVMGQHIWREPPFEDCAVLVNAEGVIIGVPPSYTDNHNDFALVEQELARRGLQEQYIRTVMGMLDRNAEEAVKNLWYVHTSELWMVHTAPLDIRCKAALRACGVEVG